MALTAATLIDSVSSTLLDTAHRTWSRDELLDCLNEALRSTSLAKPDVYIVEGPVTLLPGEVQTIPADGVALVDVTRNTGGRTISQVDKTLLDEASRFWPASTRVPGVEHYTADPRDPLRFTVYPPNDGFGIVDMVYAAVPPQIMYEAEEIVLADTYQAPLQNYMMGKAYQKNSKRQDLLKASSYLQQWGQMLGLDAQSTNAIVPKVASQPGTNS
jgi:hypothetical protein